MPAGTLNTHKQVFEYDTFDDDEDECEDQILTHERMKNQQSPEKKKKEAIVYYYGKKQDEIISK